MINRSGGRLISNQVDLLRVSTLSIANIVVYTSNTNVTMNPWGALSPTSSYSSRQISALVMAADFAVVWLFLLFILFLYGRSEYAEVQSTIGCSVISIAPCS